LLSSAYTHAEDDAVRWYKVEYLAFKYLAPETSEKLDTSVRLQQPEDATHYLVDQKPQTPYQLQRLTETSLSLAPAVKRLKRAANYRILDVGGWIQPMYKGNKEFTVQISGGEQFGDQRELQGTLRFFRNRFIHVKANVGLMTFKLSRNQALSAWLSKDHTTLTQDLALDWYGLLLYNPDTQVTSRDESEPLVLALNNYDIDAERESAGEPVEEKPESDQISTRYIADKTWIISESRKLRSGETHLLDHPYFGVLVTIDAIETPTQAENEETHVLQ